MTYKNNSCICKESSQSQRLQALPSEAHKLVKAETRESGSDPNVNKYNRSPFLPQPKPSRKPILKEDIQRCICTTQEQKPCYSSHHNHGPVFSNEKQSKSHRSIFYIISCNKLSLRLRLIKGGAIELCQTTYNPNKSQWPLGKQKLSFLLTLYQSTPVQTICNHTSSQNNQTHRQLITNHLSNGTTTSLKRIFTITCPTSQKNSIHSKTPNSQYIHCPLIQIPDSTSSTSRQSSPSNLTCQESKNRSPLKKRLVSTTRKNRFFLLQFQTIKKWLQYSKKSPSVRSLTTLHSSHHSTFNESQKSNSKQQRNHSCKNHNQQIQNHLLL